MNASNSTFYSMMGNFHSIETNRKFSSKSTWPWPRVPLGGRSGNADIKDITITKAGTWLHLNDKTKCVTYQSTLGEERNLRLNANLWWLERKPGWPQQKERRQWWGHASRHSAQSDTAHVQMGEIQLWQPLHYCLLPKNSKSRLSAAQRGSTPSNRHLRQWDNDHWWEAAKALPNQRTCCKCRQGGAHQLVQKFLEVFSESGPQAHAVYFLQCCRQFSCIQKVRFSNGSQARLVTEHIRLPFFYQRLTGAEFILLRQAVHESGELHKRKIAVIRPPDCNSVKMWATKLTREWIA